MESVNKSALPEHTRIRVAAAQIMAVVNGHKSETVISTELREELPSDSQFITRELFETGKDISFNELVDKVEFYFGLGREEFFRTRRNSKGNVVCDVCTIKR